MLDMDVHPLLTGHKGRPDFVLNLEWYARPSSYWHRKSKYSRPSRQSISRTMKHSVRIVYERRSSASTKRFILTARIVVGNLCEPISLPFRKWNTVNLRGAWSVTSAINELENNRSMMRTSSKANIETKPWISDVYIKCKRVSLSYGDSYLLDKVQYLNKLKRSDGRSESRAQ